jgi:hypothetical protein
MTTSFALMDASPQRLDWHDWSAKDSGGQGEDPGARLLLCICSV